MRGAAMSGFYVSLIFLGILLSVISLILIVIDKKNVFVFNKAFDDKKQELAEIINDAEQMIDELNRFSDYIVSQIDVKNEELNANIKSAEDRIRAMEERAGAAAGIRRTVDVKIEDDGIIDAAKESDDHGTGSTDVAEPKDDVASGVPQEFVNTPEKAMEAYNMNKSSAVSFASKKDKVIPFNSKYSEVLRLSKEGKEGTEIAKSLKMGKGEVELIIGLKR
jgi:hypothetical protein